MYSMTGYGHSQLKIAGVQIEITVKTVNSRYLDIKPHLPKKYLSFESDIIKLAKEYFRRGSCDVYVQRSEMQTQESVEIFLQIDIAQKWVKQMNAAMKTLKISSPLTAQDLLSIPNFVQVKENTTTSQQEKKSFLKEFKNVLEMCSQERLREGKQLARQCLMYVDSLGELAQSIQSLRKDFVEISRQNLEEKIKTLLGSSALDPTRIMQEVAILAERADIEEELVRLQEHLQHVRKLLNEKKESVGKKLDFYAQELLREVNTMGSKCGSAKITELVVTAKNTIEQLREQIQNLE